MKNKIRPSAAQIRGARGLLHLSQKDLAEALGFSRAWMTKVEAEATQPAKASLDKIVDFFWGQGLEFTQDDGVKRRSGTIEVLYGEAGFHQFLDDVYLSAQSGPEPFDIMACGVEDAKFVEAAGDRNEAHLERMASLRNIRVKSINIEEDPSRVSQKYCQYRSMDGESLGTVPFYIYGENMAIILWTRKIEIIVIRNKNVTEAYKKQFVHLWNSAKPAKHG